MQESVCCRGLPSLHHRKEGWPSDQLSAAKHALERSDGVVSRPPDWKTTPSASALEASRSILMTQPPLLAAMQGGEPSATPPRPDALTPFWPLGSA